MSQTRKIWDSNFLFLVDLTLKDMKMPPWYSVFSFLFCLELTVREQLDESDFRHYYGIFFEGTMVKLLGHSYVQSSFATITRHFDNGIPLKRNLTVEDFTDIDQHRNYSGLSNERTPLGKRLLSAN